MLVDCVLLICRMQKARSLSQVYSCLICYSSEETVDSPCLAASSLNCCFNCIWLVHVQVDCSAPVVLDVATTSQPNEMERPNNFYGSFMHVLILLAMNHSACLFSYMLQPHATILSDSAMLPSFPVQLAAIDHV